MEELSQRPKKLLLDLAPAMTTHQEILDHLLQAQAAGSIRLPVTPEEVQILLQAPEIVGTPELLEKKCYPPLLLAGNYLYPARYYVAKGVIERRIKELFANTPLPANEVTPELIGEIVGITSPSIKLEAEQARAVWRGSRENLIITGGPGTGKTTVLFFLLRELYKQHPELLELPLFMAAPSGKAAERMKESIGNTLTKIKDGDKNAYPEFYRKLATAESSTIHSLLGYQNGQFANNEENTLPRGIFAIDEASMIDIDLFAGLLAALPAGSRLFLLGDPDQLPPVDAGAVLGDLLEQKKEAVARLTKTKRSELNLYGQLEQLVQDKGNFGLPGTRELPQTGLQLLERPDKNWLPVLKKLLQNWCNTYLAELRQLAASLEATDTVTPENNQWALCQQLWALTTNSRILAAEKAGNYGIININKMIDRLLHPGDDQPYAGQLLMLKRNQSHYRLYNGDTALVVNKHGQPTKLMFKKENKFIFYPLAIFDQNELDLAFAITIHKAQGSEFDHVLLLPPGTQSQLATRQIIYTAITRAKKSVTIFGNQEALTQAMGTITKRDTGIEI